MFIILTLLAELFIVSFLILFFYRLKPRFGLVPLFVLLGSNQYFQTVLSTSFQINFFGNYSISPGAIILFSSGLFAILLIYIKEGVRTTQRLIFGIVMANLSFTLLALITNQQEGVMQGIIHSTGIAPELFKINYRIFFVGTIVLILDAFTMVILYEFFFTNISRLNMYFRLLLVMMVILCLDAILFMTGSFWGQANLGHKITGQLIAKIFTAVFFATVLYVYLRFMDKANKNTEEAVSKGKQDIFSILTYKGRFEKLQTEKAISDVQMQKIIAEKTTELEKSIRRFTILFSVQQLRLDRFTSSEQAKAFLTKVKEAFDVDACTIHLIKDDELELLSEVGISENKKEFKPMLTFPYLQEMIRKKKNLCIEDTSKDPLFKNNLQENNNVFQYISCAGAPLLRGEKVLGLLKLYVVKTKRRFTVLEMEHLQLVASQSAQIIENAQLFEQNEKHKEVLVKQIIARKNAEGAIIESEEKYRTLVQQAADAIFIVDQEGNYLEANNSASLITGYSIEELKKMSGRELTAEEDLKKSPLKTEEIKKGDTVYTERIIKKKDSTLINVDIKAKLMDNGKVIVILRDITERKKTEKQIEKYNEELRDLTAHLLNIREEERHRIGREIHDDLGQQLTAIKMDVAWLAKKTPEQTPALKDKFQNIIGLLDNSNQSVRRILSELRPSILDDFSLLEALKWHGKQFSANTGILLEIESNENDFKVKEEIATCIYRIFQEALTNVSRYARAKKVLTTIQLSKDSISVTVEDDGVGFDQSQMQTKKTFGILGMKERVRSLSGVLEIISSPGKGTKINFRLPK